MSFKIASPQFFTLSELWYYSSTKHVEVWVRSFQSWAGCRWASWEHQGSAAQERGLDEWVKAFWLSLRRQLFCLLTDIQNKLFLYKVNTSWRAVRVNVLFLPLSRSCSRTELLHQTGGEFPARSDDEGMGRWMEEDEGTRSQWCADSQSMIWVYQWFSLHCILTLPSKWMKNGRFRCHLNQHLNHPLE